MSATDQTYFRQILRCILRAENEDRTKAEEIYNGLDIQVKISYLVKSIEDRELGSAEKQTACVLLRRLISNDFNDFCSCMTPEQQISLRATLLAMLRDGQDDHVRKKLCDVISELSRNSIDDEGNNLWPDIIQFLVDCLNSAHALSQDSALRIFSNVPSIFGNQEQAFLDTIKEMLSTKLSPSCDLSIRIQATKALCSFLMQHEKELQIQNHFQSTLPQMIQVLETSISQCLADDLLKAFIDLCESSSKFIRHQLSSVIQLCLKTLGNNDVDDDTKHLVLEVIVILCQSNGPMMRKASQSFITAVVNHCLMMMTDLDEEPEWSCIDAAVETEEDSNAVVGETSLDRIACALGGKIVLPHVTKAVPSMLSNPDWRYRHAALMAISAIGEGCHKQMVPILDEIMMGGVLPFLRDQHPRVRYAACNATGQIASDFGPNLQKQFHENVVSGLLFLLEDNLNPRVQAHAGAALVNFCEDCPKYILVKYLDTIMSTLLSVLNNKYEELINKGTKLVLEQMVTTVAAVADTVEEQFVSFYDRLVPYLKRIINDARTPELRLLRGKTLECVSLIGLAVGTEKFMNDAKEVMNILLECDLGEYNAGEEDSYNTYLISAWARICIVLGKDFQPYLPLVIDRVLKTAAMKPEVALLDNETLEECEYNSDWHFVQLGEQQNFGIKTAGLEDKVSACEMLVCYARELKEGFAEYAEQVCRLMVPLLKFYFHDGVRTAAAQSLPFLLECVQGKGPEYVKDMWHFICPELLSAITTDTEIDVAGDMYTSLGQCIEFLGKGCLTVEWMNNLMSIIEKTLFDHFSEAEKCKEQKDEDYDENAEESPATELSYKLSKVSDILHSLFLAYGQDFFPYFDRILPLVIQLLQPDQHSMNLQWGLCIFDDLIEYAGPACKKYDQYFLPSMISCMTHNVAEVRQACFYGIGVLAMHGGLDYAATCAEVVGKLVDIIGCPNGRSDDNITATENAVAALTKILKYNNSLINVDEILPHWLQSLPVFEDEDEIPHVYGYLCDLIESNHAIILGVNNSNLPKIISVMLEVFVRESVKKDHVVATRMILIIRQVQKSNELLQGCISQLTKEQQVALYEILNSE